MKGASTPFPRPRESGPAKLEPHERRGVVTYKLARWDPGLACWRDGKQGHPTYLSARTEARKPGRYRISEITDGGRRDLEPFEVNHE